MLRLAYITDQHISLEVENSLGIDTKTRFLDLLNIIILKRYDGIILGGDLGYTKGDLSTYLWFCEKLQVLQLPVCITPGNHDNPGLIAKLFPDLPLNTESEMYYQRSWGDINMIFLDTSKGFMLQKQYTWLENLVSASPEKNVWICMHHPPVITGSMHMDGKYAFQQIEKFGRFCADYPLKKFHVFSGHCHLERTIVKDNIHVYITPSTYVNIDPDFEVFTAMRHQKSGFRELIWLEQGAFLTNVLYCD